MTPWERLQNPLNKVSFFLLLNFHSLPMLLNYLNTLGFFNENHLQTTHLDHNFPSFQASILHVLSFYLLRKQTLYCLPYCLFSERNSPLLGLIGRWFFKVVFSNKTHSFVHRGNWEYPYSLCYLQTEEIFFPVLITGRVSFPLPAIS